MHERLRKLLMDRWARLVTTAPKTTIVLAVLLAVACVLSTWCWLEFRPDRSDLVDRDLPWNSRYFDHKDNFPRWNDLIVALDGDADDARVDELARNLADALRVSERVVAADAGYDAAEAGPRLFRIAPDPEFDETLQKLRSLRRLTESAPNANAALTYMTRGLRPDAAGDGTGAASLRDLRQVLRPYLEAIFDNEVFFTLLKVDRSRWVPLRSATGRIRFIRVQFATSGNSLDAVGDNVYWLRNQLRDTVAASDLPEIEWGVTGIPAIEADETAQSIRDSTRASVLAFVLITVLMIVVFRGIAVPLIAAATLLIGIAWSFGWLMLSVGHLQLLSVVFTVILLGIGIDFAVHLIARLELLRDAFDSLPPAMSRVFQGMGPGLITGALTTAAAFGVTALTRFRGMAEMGIIAAGGIILCLLASFCVLPALLSIAGWKRVIRHRHGGEEAHFAHGRLDSVDRHPYLALTIAAGIIALMTWPATRVQYDPNVLKLQPPGIESVLWERRIVEDDNRSAWAALVHTDSKNAEDVADALRALPEVAEVGGVGRLYPPDRQRRRGQIAAVRNQQFTPIAVSTDPQNMMDQLLAIQGGLRLTLDLHDPDPLAKKVLADLQRAHMNWLQMDDAGRKATHDRVEQAYSAARAQLQQYLSTALLQQPLTGDDLPPLLRELWIGSDGRWLMEVYPAEDARGRSILNPERLGRFIAALRTVRPDVLGPPVQIYESGELIKREYLRAAVFALGAVLLILLLDFQSLVDALSAIVPVAIGFLGAFAMLGTLGMTLNFANIIVMPLIFGIGVDAGVHMVHRWRVEPLGRPAGLSGATGRGITITMLTTMIGFGCMLTAEHRGIRSLGLVMVSGLAVTLAACYFVLPAVLRLRTSRDMRDSAGPARASETGEDG